MIFVEGLERSQFRGSGSRRMPCAGVVGLSCGLVSRRDMKEPTGREEPAAGLIWASDVECDEAGGQGGDDPGAGHGLG